jgi:hypothetical protein
MFNITVCLCIICFRIQTVGKHLNHNETLNWSLEGGYPDNKAKKTYPRRALTSGATAGLNIFIVMEYMDMDSYCSISVEGVKVSTMLLLQKLIMTFVHHIPVA